MPKGMARQMLVSAATTAAERARQNGFIPDVERSASDVTRLMGDEDERA